VKLYTVETIADRISNVIGTRKIFKTTPATVQEQFSEIAQLETSTPTKYLWKFTGTNTELGLRWIQVEFQPTEPSNNDKWQLLQVVIGIIPPERKFSEFYNTLISSLSERIGKPVEYNYNQKSWSMGKYREIWLSEGLYENPRKHQTEHVILIRVAVLQGENE